MYDEKRVWVPSEPMIPNDKYDFIIKRGLKAFAEDCGLPIIWDTDDFETWKDRTIKWAEVPDDWSREQYRKAVEPLMPELFKEAIERERLLKEFLEQRKEEKEADDDQ